ncbi:MAG: hypothetical protein V4503_05400 [Gemmatimonadota bacterium]
MRCPLPLPAPVFAPVVLLALTATLGAQSPAVPPDTAALRTITARGRILAAYDQAAWHGTDAVMARLPNPAGIEGFLATQDAGGKWHVLFGRLDATAETLLVAARADQATRPDSFLVTLSPNPVAGTDAERRAFLALKTAGTDLASAPPPFRGTYNSYALPAPDGSWLVFFLPGQTQPDLYPHGGDFRYEVSVDGRRILSKFQMHRSVLMSRVPAEAVAGAHTVITADLPQESDVFLVLSRSPRKPELIATDHYNFEIHEDGTITWRYGKR